MGAWDDERAAIEGEPSTAPSAPSPRAARSGARAEEFLAQEYEDRLLKLLARQHAEQMTALRKLYGKLLDVEKRIVALERRPAATAPPSGDGESASGLDLKAVASDADLDGAHGDPMIKYDPKKWEGQSFVGYKFSETTPEYLDAMAKGLSAAAYMAQKDTDEKKRKGARYKAMDAARARGWAQRLRSGAGGAPGGQAPSAPTSGGFTNGAARAPAPPGDDVMF